MKYVLLIFFTTVMAGYSFGQDNKIIVPPLGGWKANPAFFEAEDDSTRMQVVSLWLESVKYEAWEARNQGTPFSETENPASLRQYAMPAFYGLFGKQFAELNAADRQLIAKALRGYSGDARIINSLALPLEEKAESAALLKEWTALFANPPAPARSLVMLGNPDFSLKDSLAEALFFRQPENFLRIELLTSASVANESKENRKTRQVYSALFITSENGEILYSATGKAEASIRHPQTDDSVSARKSLLMNTEGKTSSLYAFLRTYSYCWGVTANKIKWYEKASALVSRPVDLTSGRIKELIANDSKNLQVSDLGAGEKEKRAGWMCLRLQ